MGSHQGEVCHLPKMCGQTRASFCGEGQAGSDLPFCQASREWEDPRLWRSPALSPEEIRVSQRGIPKIKKGRWAFTGLLWRTVPASLLARKKKPTHNNLGTLVQGNGEHSD